MFKVPQYFLQGRHKVFRRFCGDRMDHFDTGSFRESQNLLLGDYCVCSLALPNITIVFMPALIGESKIIMSSMPWPQVLLNFYWVVIFSSYLSPSTSMPLPLWSFQVAEPLAKRASSPWLLEGLKLDDFLSCSWLCSSDLITEFTSQGPANRLLLSGKP